MPWGVLVDRGLGATSLWQERLKARGGASGQVAARPPEHHGGKLRGSRGGGWSVGHGVTGGMGTAAVPRGRACQAPQSVWKQWVRGVRGNGGSAWDWGHWTTRACAGRAVGVM